MSRVGAFVFGALLITAAAHAQSLAVMPDDSIAVAHDGRVELFAAGSRRALASFGGVEHPGAIAATHGRIAVADPLANEVVLIDTTSQRARKLPTGETPVAALFAGSDLYVLSRDSAKLERFSANGDHELIGVGRGASQLREANGKLYVYAAAEGLLQEISPAPFRVVRESKMAPFASDLAVDAKSAYLVYPGEGLVRFVSIDRFRPDGESRVGAVPVAIANVSRGTALTARTLAIADPASKRVWIQEGRQSTLEAFTRGFLRGLIGLGLFGGRNSAFPTGVDRVAARGGEWLAYDSSSGTLYRFTKSRSNVLARGIAPRGFVLASSGAIWWQDGTLVAEKSAR